MDSFEEGGILLPTTEVVTTGGLRMYVKILPTGQCPDLASSGFGEKPRIDMLI